MAPRGETAGNASSSASMSMAAHYNFCYLACPYGSRPLRALAHRVPAHRGRPHRAVQLAVGAEEQGRVRAPHRGHRPVAQHAAERTGDHRRPRVARARLGRGTDRGRPARALLPDAAAGHVRQARGVPDRAGQGVQMRLHEGRAGPLARAGRPREARVQVSGHLPRQEPAAGNAGSGGAVPHARRGATTFRDLVKGEITTQHKELQDEVILRSDGVPLYNFGAVVDDVEMEITMVARGDDHVVNTPRQILMYQALDYPLPTFAHLPMILGADKQRLSKRHGAVSVLQYRDEGYLPGALVNYLVRLGWSHGDQEIFTIPELIEKFDWEPVGATACVFNPQKLEWLIQQWIKMTPPSELARLTGA